jgi:hypothetical protein
MDGFIRYTVPMLLMVAIAAAYFLYLVSSWSRYIAFVTSVQAQIKEALSDEHESGID